MADFPNSYRDPLYASLDTANEQRLGLPVGLLSAIRTDGERTNADRISSAGAVTPYQFIPATRKAILEKYGIDVTLSPENASEGAGLLLQESLKRNKGDPELAVREYHGGTDKSNWGPVNNAYAARVMVGQTKTKITALENGFAKFMAANPATAAEPQAAPAQTEDKLSAGFGQWLKDQQPKAGQIPGVDGGNTTLTPEADTSLVDKIIGAGEAGLSVVTGATGGMAGMIGGAIGGLAGSIASGEFGTQQGVRGVEQAAARGAEALTYQPRTASGQQQAQAVGEIMQNLIPLAPLAGEAAIMGRAAAPAARAVTDQAAAATSQARTGLAAIPGRVASLGQGGAVEAPTAGTMGSVGAAGVDMALQRTQAAGDLPVPVELTKGQATRDPAQLRFEVESAKDPSIGGPLRERYADQNLKVRQNFDHLIERSGADAPSLVETGRVVDKALVKDAAKAKAEYRIKYRKAEIAGQMEDPVSTASLVDFLAENSSFDSPALAPSLSLAQKELIRLGGARIVDGSLVPGELPLRQTELLRRQIGASIDSNLTNTTNMRIGVQMKEILDIASDGLGGQLYKEARKARQRYGQLYENNAIVSDLLSARKADRKIALEDVFKKTILNGSREDLSMLRRTLQVSGSAEGRQAWRELQGATVRHLIDEATKGSGSDLRGNPIVSAHALNSAVNALDKSGKLDFILSKKGAQTVRDLNELTKHINTTPPGVNNTSNTASVVLQALAEAGVSGSMFGLPVPVITGIRLLSRQVKDNKVRARINESLNDPNKKPDIKAPPPKKPSRTLH